MDISTVISLGISIISIVFCIATFVRNGNKEIKRDSIEEATKWGRLEERLNNLEKQIDKVLSKLDGYDKEIDIKIEKALEQHIETWHKTHNQ